MTQDTVRPDAGSRKLHSDVIRRRSVTSGDFLLSDEDFRFAADCERMRVDRNGSVLSLLLIRLSNRRGEDLAFFARLLEGRIRVTDTPGLLRDGRVAVLLPDTNSAGAWKVAADISEIFPPGPGRPECEVLEYPNNARTNKRDEENANSDDEFDSSGDKANESQSSLTEVRPDDARSTNEFFFAKHMPIWKRTLDVLGGSVGLLASAPLLAVAAITVKCTSNGPAFFQQRREGHGGRQFTMWKLRTMRVDAEKLKQDLRKFSQQDGPAFKMKRDPRTTAVGRFLRWSSMDELPQFWNVVKGDMSLVGPRPLPVEESAACQGWQRRRLQVVPGMTCTWQVCERGNVSFDEWVRMDLRYVKNYSLIEDLRLLFLTLPSLLLQRGMR
ncbi:MAG: sugar transferase [Planctomycetota bacterium]